MTTAFQDMAPDGTLAQQELLFRGQRAVVAAPVLAWSSLTNGYTFVTITPAGTTDSRTINAALAASTDRPTFCAALAAELNTAGTTAYNWSVNASSPVDGLIGTAKAYGSAYNSAPTGTALVGGVGSISTSGADPIATIQNSPPYYKAGVGGLTANVLCYYGSSTLLKAKADAVATARKILGATSQAYSAGASAALIRKGPARILVDAACSPVVGAPAYLSSATAGAVASTLLATAYPVHVGIFLEGVKDSNSTVLIDLDLSDARDDAAEWVLLDSVLGAAATAQTVAMTRAFAREISFTAQKIGTTSDATGKCDNSGVSEWYSTTTAVATSTSTTDASNWLLTSAGAGGTNISVKERWITGTDWEGDADGATIGWSGAGSKFAFRLKFRNHSAPDRFTADFGATQVFGIGSRVLLAIKRRLA